MPWHPYGSQNINQRPCSPVSPHGAQESNSGSQALQQLPLPTERSLRPSTIAILDIL